MQWYITCFDQENKIIKKLTEKQRVLYGLDENMNEKFLNYNNNSEQNEHSIYNE